jgi:hypothetical protein
MSCFVLQASASKVRKIEDVCEVLIHCTGIEKVNSFKKHHNNGLLVRLSPSRMFITYDSRLSTAYCSAKNGD